MVLQKVAVRFGAEAASTRSPFLVATKRVSYLAPGRHLRPFRRFASIDRPLVILTASPANAACVNWRFASAEAYLPVVRADIDRPEMQRTKAGGVTMMSRLYKENRITPLAPEEGTE